MSLKELWHENIAVLGQIFADQLITLVPSARHKNVPVEL